MAIVTYNDNGTIKVVKFGNKVVSTDADPIQKDWVFLHGSESSSGTDIQHEVEGVASPTYSLEGCASPHTLGSRLASLSNPNNLTIGIRAAIKMNASLGGEICDTWAIFEVQEV